MPIYNNSKFVSIMRPLPKGWPTGIYGIPVIKREKLPISLIGNGLFLTSLNNASAKDKDPQRKIVHCFAFDNSLERCYKHPFKFLEKVSPYYGATSPDFSMHSGMEEWQIIEATGKSRWLGAYLQSYGIRTFPTVGWVDKNSYDICFTGLEDESVFFVSTLGTINEESKNNFHDGFVELRNRFPHSKIVCVGQKPSWFPKDICVISYTDSFGIFDYVNPGWQGKLFNWDYSKEGC